MYLLIGDLHLTDKARDAYRFDIFKWIAAQQRVFKPKATFLLGDLTDQKDKHSASLVNKVINELVGLKPPIYILKGNHDYIDPLNPFFGFLGFIPGVTFVTNPIIVDNVALLPHCRDEKVFKLNCKGFSSRELAIELLLIHNTVQGAIAETGSRLNGFSTAPIEAMSLRLGCYAGDIHRPHITGSVTYVGSPYHIRFGDDFLPRCLLLNSEGTTSNLQFPAPHKWQIQLFDPKELLNVPNLTKGDHVKITVELEPEEAIEWKRYKSEVKDLCERQSLILYGIDLKINSTQKKVKATAKPRLPVDIYAAFCEKENVAKNIQSVGKALIRV